MIRAILTSGSMRSLRHKPDRSCATKPGHTACHRHEQIGDVEEARDAVLAEAEHSTRGPALLLNLRGIGPEFAAVLWSEGLSRRFDNRRQVAAYAGLAPTPWQSGQISQDQGVSKSGNPRLRATLIQVAWLWVRHQPTSALAAWFKARVSQNGGH